MILMVGVNIVNIILNPVLIFGLAGFPAFWYCGICSCNYPLTRSGTSDRYAPPCAVLQPHHIPENLEP